MQVKGITIRNILLALENLEGKAAVDAVMAELPFASQQLLEGPILVSTYFPVSVSADIHLAIRQTLGHGTWDMNRRVGTEAARIDFKGIYKVFLRLMDYDATLDRLVGAWRQYNSQGEVHWLTRERESATCEIVGVAGFNEGQWVSIAGRIEGVLLLCGAKSARVELTRTWPTECHATARWVR